MAELRLEARLTARSAFHLLHRELLAVAWAVTALVVAVVFLVIGEGLLPRLVMLLAIGWCAYVGWGWGRAAHRKVAVCHSGVPELVLDDLGIRVRTVLGHLDGAWLAWADCAAVVVSRASDGGAVPVSRYVQFVPVHPDRVEGHPVAGDRRPRLLGLSPADALTTWLELRGSRPGADEVAAWVGRHRPRVRLLGAPAPADQSGSPE